MRPILTLCLFGVSLLGAISPASAATKAKGTAINGSTTLRGMTGSCVCDQRWYRVGLRPGAGAVQVKLVTTASSTVPSYGLRASLMQGTMELDGGQVVCTRKQRPCLKTITLKYRVSKPAIYSILVYGVSAEGISYTLRVRGKTYNLR